MDIDKLKKQDNLILHEPIANQHYYLELFFKRNLIDNYKDEITCLYQKKQMVYVDKKRKICFLGFDEQGVLCYIQKYSVYTKTNFFTQIGNKIGILVEKEKAKTLFITESFTDAMHYKALYYKKAKTFSFLSIGRSSNLKEVITKRLNSIQKYNHIIISFDKNKKGKHRADFLCASLQQLYPDKHIQIKYPKYSSWLIDLNKVSTLRTNIVQKERL